MATHDEIVTANRATFDAWNAHDPDSVAAVFAEDAVIRDVGSPDPISGREAIRTRVADLIEAFPDLQLRQLDLVVGEDANADRWEFTGTHRGEFLGLPGSGRSIKVEGATFSRFDEHGLVVEDVNFWDVPALLAQLGVQPG